MIIPAFEPVAYDSILINNLAQVIICSYLGRPKGKIVEELRLAPVAKLLSS